MAEVSERVYVMKENFMKLHTQGHSIAEIAEMHGLSKVTVYRHLDEIARDNGVLREDLLVVVKNVCSDATWHQRHQETKIRFEQLKTEITQTKEETQKLLGEIEAIIEEEKE